MIEDSKVKDALMYAFRFRLQDALQTFEGAPTGPETIQALRRHIEAVWLEATDLDLAEADSVDIAIYTRRPSDEFNGIVRVGLWPDVVRDGYHDVYTVLRVNRLEPL